MSKLVTQATAADGSVSFTSVDAGITDVVTSVFSTEKVLTGSMALVQRAGILAAGMSLQNYRLTGGWNFFKA